MITGSHSQADCHQVVTIFKEKIRNLSGTYQIHLESHFEDHFGGNLLSYLKYMNKNYLVFLKLFMMFNLNLDLRLELILNKKFMAQQNSSDQNNTLTPIDAGYLKVAEQSDIEGFLRVVQIYDICHMYFPNVLLLQSLEQPTHVIHHIINTLYQGQSVNMPVTLEMDHFDDPFEVVIQNYNTKFSSGFRNNRETLTQILNDKYKKQGLIASANFDPTVYQGINVKYISRVLCQPQCTSSGRKKNKTKCQCKEISFFIFQEGNVMITGGRSWEQLMDGYRVVTQILKDEYHQIMITPNPNPNPNPNTCANASIPATTTTTSPKTCSYIDPNPNLNSCLFHDGQNEDNNNNNRPRHPYP